MLSELERPASTSIIPDALRPYEDVLDLVPTKTGSVIIDYNSGDNSLAQAFDNYTTHDTGVFAVDLSNPAFDIPAPKAHFAVCAGLIEHMTRDERLVAMRTMLDHLNPGGHLVVRFNRESLKIMAIAARLDDMADIVITPVTAPYDGHQLIFERR